MFYHCQKCIGAYVDQSLYFNLWRLIIFCASVLESQFGCFLCTLVQILVDFVWVTSVSI